MGRCAPQKPIGYQNCTWLDKYVTVKTITTDCLQRHSHNAFNCSSNDLAFWAQELVRAFKVCPDVQNLTQVDDDDHFAINYDNIGMPLAKDFRKRRI